MITSEEFFAARNNTKSGSKFSDDDIAEMTRILEELKWDQNERDVGRKLAFSTRKKKRRMKRGLSELSMKRSRS